MRRALTAALLVGLSLPSRAEPPPEPELELGANRPHPGLRHRPLGITLSGGVSLGAYEAGYLHYTLRQMRAAKLRPRVLTGASAGSINAFIGLMESCATRPPQLPTESLLYQTWIPMGLSRLFRAEDVTDTSVLSRESFAPTVNALRASWDAGLPTDCDLHLGAAVTRKAPRSVQLSSNEVTIPRMTERFLVRIRGRGPGQAPRVENARTADLGRVLALLPLDGPGTQPFDSLVEVLFASSGFPLAFPPMKVHHCSKPVHGDGVPSCRVDEAKGTLFIDGGMFDNRPIGVAYSVLKGLGAHPALLFIDPALRAWPMAENELGETLGKGVLGLVARIFIDFVDTAMSAELDHLIEREPELAENLFIGLGYFPPASAPMSAFFGFVEQELRRFDYYLGMYNARRFAAIERGLPVNQLGDDGADTGQADHPAWRPLRCLRALWDGDGDPTVQCAGDELTDFRILAQISGEHVLNDCLRSPLGADSKHPLCIAARAGKEAPRVPYVRRAGSAQQGAGESDTDWTMRRLGELGFEFADLGLSRKQADRGMRVLRQRLGMIVAELAKKQGPASLAYQALGTYALDLVHYLPARHIVHLVLGDRVEVGWSYTEPTSQLRWARLALKLELRGLDTIFSSRPVYFGLAPMAGFELEPLPISRPGAQVRIGLFAGYLFSTEDHMLDGPCDVMSQSPCSRPITEAVLSLSLLSALRLQLAAAWLPPVRPGERHDWTIGPSFGVQLPLGKR